MNKVMMTGLVMAAMACGVQAATVYDKDGTKVDIKGDVQIQLRQKPGEDQDMYMDYDDLTVGFYGKHKNDADVTAFSHLKMDWKKQADGSAKAAVDEGSVGVAYGPVKAHIGRIDWGSDSFCTDEGIELGEITAMGECTDVGGHETIQAVFDLGGMADLILSHDFEVKGNSAVSEGYLVTNPKKTFGLEAGLLFQSYDTAVVEADEEEGIEAEASETLDSFGIRAVYSFGKVSVGADYSSNEDLDVLNFSAKVKVAKNASVAAGYSMESPDEGDDVGTWYANVKQKVAKNATVFAEIGNTDKDDSDMGYLAGMQVKF